MEKLTITIKRNGEIKFHVEGVKGAKCVDVTKPFEEALGGNTLEHELTGEFYEDPEAEGTMDVGR